ncbi:DUF679 domain-containing protein [Quillaja saponaria]|uniref:DUF679 domain-containing protein n=1 Tax=Quillaja saponaria TaxID=32244 RepID=A0AAD7M130_QUISA|nr:DUF679 domain-containing protein [Quillaja saponaria]
MMSDIRQRPTIPTKEPLLPDSPATKTTTSTAITTVNSEPETLKPPQAYASSFPQRAISQTLTNTANLANLLPTGTLLTFQIVTPIFTNNDGNVYHGLVTSKGMWLFDYPDPSGSGLPDLSQYKIRFMDWVHAVLSVFVFGAVALRDKNVLSCFYPMPKHETQEVLNIAPVGIGLICSLLFVAFPTRRHGIGYPVTAGK